MPNSLKSLLPCPWCPDGVSLTSNGDENYYVECHGCGASGPACDTPDEAVTAWNTRAPIAEGGGDVSDHLIQSTAEPADGVEVRLRIGKKLLEEIDSAADWNDIVRDAMIRHMLQYALNTKPPAIESLSRQGGEAPVAWLCEWACPYSDEMARVTFESKASANSRADEVLNMLGVDARVLPLFTRESEAGDWVLVPRECTTEMELALSDALATGDYSIAECLDKAIAAAPAPGGGQHG